jgi:hypothetical protein
MRRAIQLERFFCAPVVKKTAIALNPSVIVAQPNAIAGFGVTAKKSSDVQIGKIHDFFDGTVLWKSFLKMKAIAVTILMISTTAKAPVMLWPLLFMTFLTYSV